MDIPHFVSLLMDIWIVSTFVNNVNNAAVNIGVQIFIGIPVLFLYFSLLWVFVVCTGFLYLH